MLKRKLKKKIVDVVYQFSKEKKKKHVIYSLISMY